MKYRTLYIHLINGCPAEVNSGGIIFSEYREITKFGESYRQIVNERRRTKAHFRRLNFDPKRKYSSIRIRVPIGEA